MMKRTLFLALLLTACGPGVESNAQAATVAAASCSHTDVQTAINTAVAGDTVTVPAGSCTWTSTVTITGKALTLTGAGKTLTLITDQGSGGAALNITASATNFVDVSGFKFTASTAHANGMIQISGTQFSQAFRFHDNEVVASASGGRGIFVYYVYGLIDNNTISGASANQAISIRGGNVTGADGGFIPWQQPLTLGSANAVYIESNTLSKTTLLGGAEDIIDAYAGARFVIRHNTFNDAKAGFHGLDSGSMRSPVSFEIYSNVYTNNAASAPDRAMTIRGGTGMVFDNTFTANPGGFGNMLIIYTRACNLDPTILGWGEHGCDGTDYELGSTSLSANASRLACDISTNPTLGVGGCVAFPTTNWAAHVRFCSLDPETLCTGDSSCSAAGKGVCTRYLDGSSGDSNGGYPGRDQPGRGPGQVLNPIYIWNTTGTPVGAAQDQGSTNCDGRGLAHYLAENRDFYNYSTAVGAPQTVGVRRGALASRPATCTAGVAYWVTDAGEWDSTNGATADGRLDICTATNTWTAASYTPYTYPHPLIPAANPPAPDPLPGTPSIASFTGPTWAIFMWPKSTDAAHKAYNVYRCTSSGACSVLVKTITPASAIASRSSETMFIDTSLYTAGTYYYSVSDVNTSDYVGPATTPVSVTVTGKQ